MPSGIAFLLMLLLLSGCDGPASALMPAGEEAQHVARLYWMMVVGGAVIWSAVIAIAVYAARISPERHDPRTASRLILFGGAIFPAVILVALLIYGLALMPDLRAGNAPLKIRISGEQWWWRITYLPPQGEPVETANDWRLPVGAPVELILESPDVIHSFWVPTIAGKLDMIPGRTTRLVMRATETGTYRGLCAEFCGPSHARMAFMTVVMQQPAFDLWLAREARPAQAVAGRGERGAELFLAAGCGACHTVRGTQATGSIGPDLTHIGSRRTIAAGSLDNNRETLARWIGDPSAIKPGARMPPFAALGSDEIAAIATYLHGLK